MIFHHTEKKKTHDIHIYIKLKYKRIHDGDPVHLFLDTLISFIHPNKRRMKIIVKIQNHIIILATSLISWWYFTSKPKALIIISKME